MQLHQPLTFLHVRLRSGQPVRQLVQLFGKALKGSHRFLVPIWRYSHLMRSVADIDSRRVGMHHIQAHHLVVALLLFVVALLLCSAHLTPFLRRTSASPASSGLEFFSTGSTLRSRAESHHVSDRMSAG